MHVAWTTLAMVGGALVVGALGRLIWGLRPQGGMSGLPTTPLERPGWVGLGATAVVGIGLAILVALEGATGLFEDATSLIVWILVLGGMSIWFVGWRVINRRSGGAVVDERDLAILARSLSVESVIALLSLATWMVVLTESFQDEGVVAGYMQLIFWSTFIGGLFGRTLGIILGYRRETVLDA